MNSTLIIQFVIVFSIVFKTSCVDSLKPSWEYEVDNPLDKEIVIEIDEKEWSIPAYTSLKVKVNQGKHVLTYNGNSVHFVTKANSNKSVTIINPTLSNYMLQAIFYARENAQNDDISALYLENSHEYQTDEGVVMLPVKVLNTLFIEQSHTNWQFGLGEDTKSEMSTSYPGKKYVFHKLYRESEYKKEYAEELPQGVIFPVNSRKLSEQPAYVFPTESLMSDCDAANQFVKDLESRWNNIIADPSDMLQDVAKLRYDAVSELDRNSKLNKACGAVFNSGRDDKEFREMLSRMSDEMTYLSNGTSFIVK